MNLVVFDIDGTLIRSVGLDDDCFVRSFADVLGIEGISSDWTRYPDQTDSGLSGEIVRRHLGRDPTAEEIEMLRERCCQLLQRAVARSGSAIWEVDGAARLLSALRGDFQWRVAVASGSWRETAQVKLACAQIDLGDLPAAFAEDSPRRGQILRIAVERAAAHYGAAEFDKVVYLGDGVWDVEAAREQGVPFVGVASGGNEAALLAAGARAVLSDFSQVDSVFRLLQEARVPGPPT